MPRLPGKGQGCPGPVQEGSRPGGGLDYAWPFLAFPWKSGRHAPPTWASVEPVILSPLRRSNRGVSPEVQRRAPP
jgi:hypothetical protein